MPANMAKNNDIKIKQKQPENQMNVQCINTDFQAVLLYADAQNLTSAIWIGVFFFTIFAAINLFFWIG